MSQGYQPTEELDTSNPPQGGSGVPNDTPKFDPNTLRVGVLIGIGDDGQLYYSNFGHSQGSIYELLGLAETAVDLLKYVRDGVVKPSVHSDLKDLIEMASKTGFSMERLTQAIIEAVKLKQPEETE